MRSRRICTLLTMLLVVVMVCSVLPLGASAATAGFQIDRGVIEADPDQTLTLNHLIQLRCPYCNAPWPRSYNEATGVQKPENGFNIKEKNATATIEYDDAYTEEGLYRKPDGSMVPRKGYVMHVTYDTTGMKPGEEKTITITYDYYVQIAMMNYTGSSRYYEMECANPACGEIFQPSDFTSTLNDTLTFTVKIKEYTITYLNGYDGGKVAEYKQAKGEDTKKPEDPTREGYKFAGWTPEVSPKVTGDATYTAKWVKSLYLDFAATKYLDGGAPADGLFHFVMSGTGGAVRTPSNVGSSVKFNALEFKEEGTYRFSISETDKTDPKYIYDDSTYEVVVEIGKDAEGNPTHVSTKYLKNGVETPPVFNNYSKREIFGTKVWDDGDDADGKRPATITVNVNGTSYTVTPGADGKWKLPGYFDRYGADGKTEIPYTVTEEQVADYEPGVVTGNVNSGFIITNRRTPDTRDIIVTKEWQDNNDQDGKRPESVTVRLLDENQQEVKSLTLSEANNWRGTFEDVQMNHMTANGVQAIQYTVEEVSVDGYSAEVTGDMATGFKVTNTHTPETMDITVNKVWLDDETDHDGVDAKLCRRDDSAAIINTLSESCTFTGLPVYENGKKIEYYVVEENCPAGYTGEVVKNSETSYTITNTKVADVTVRKVWNDADDQDGLRTAVTLQLYADGTPVENGSITFPADTAGDTWTHTFQNLPTHKLVDGAVQKINYTVDEETVPADYTKSVNNDTLTVTNEHIPAMRKITVKEFWMDDKEISDRPKTTASIKNGDQTIDSGTVAPYGGYYSESKLFQVPVFANGVKIDYSVVLTHTDQTTGAAVQLTGYETTAYWNDEETVYNVIHTQLKDVTITKKWDDNGNQDGLRTDVTLQLYADGVTKADYTFPADTAGDTWTHTFENLPTHKRSEGGSPVAIVYTIDETAVPEDYTKSINNDTLTVTNTHTPEVIASIQVEKQWDHTGEEKQENPNKPASVTVQLLANGEAAPNQQPLTLNAANGWKGEFKNLPKKANGVDIVYTVREDKVEDYVAAYEGTVADGFVITNTYAPGTMQIPVKAVWVDGQNQDGLRPASVTVRLMRGRTEVASKVLNPANGWSEVFTVKKEDSVTAASLQATYAAVGAPAMKARAVRYTLKQDAVPEYKTTSSGDAEKGFVFTNTHVPATISTLTVKKSWEDFGNRYDLRPDSVTVRIFRTDASGAPASKPVATAEVKGGVSGWKHTFKKLDLPAYEGGKKITYIIAEDTVPGYTLTATAGTVKDGGTVTLTNALETLDGGITVTKLWKGDKPADRPGSITVYLYANGETVAEGTMKPDADGKWSYTFEDIPAGWDYTVGEKQVKGYGKPLVDGYTITNARLKTPYRPSDKLLQTGQLNWPIPVLTIGGTALLAIGLYLMIQKKKGRYES